MSGTSVVEGLECWASRSGGSGFESLSCQTSKCDGALNPPVILGYHWLVRSLTAGWVFCMCAVQYQHKILIRHTKFLPILQEFVAYPGCCLKTMQLTVSVKSDQKTYVSKKWLCHWSFIQHFIELKVCQCKVIADWFRIKLFLPLHHLSR